MSSVPTYYLFLGNPGNGKSTLANAFLGWNAFQSGVSPGTGMTEKFHFQSRESGDIVADGPGLDDAKKREEAAKEITKMLMAGKGNYKLIFVSTLVSGRVRGIDIATMKLILDAIAPKVDEVMFGIIINKVSERMMSILTDEGSDSYKKIVSSFNIGNYKTPYILPYQNNPELEDMEDVLHSPTPALKMFLALLPAVRLEPSMVQQINATEFKAIEAKLNSEIKKMRDSKLELEQAMKEQQQAFGRQLESMKKTHEKDIAEATAQSEIMLASGLTRLDEEHLQMIEELRYSHKQQMDALHAANRGRSLLSILLAFAGLAN